MKKKPLSYRFLSRLLIYDSLAGSFTWRPRPSWMFARNSITGLRSTTAARWNSENAGKPALAQISKGYRRGRLFGRYIFAHQAVWLFEKGEWPRGEIDHINGDPQNNHISNLRRVTSQQNTRNQARRRKGIPLGVYRRKDKWVAMIRSETKLIYLGRFTSIDAAAAARKLAEKKHGFHPNHGRLAK